MNTQSTSQHKTYYGLPQEIIFCKKCVISNQRPSSANETQHTADSTKTTITFDKNGVCDACRVTEIKSKIDWDQREASLIELCNKYRKNDGSYDCLVPGSGGKDSFFQAHVLKYKYGMHPLTITWAPHIYTPWGWQNFQSWIHAGFDNILTTPNGKVHKLLTRLAVDNLFHPFQPFIIGQKGLALKMAKKYNIELIFYGENEAEYGNPIKDTENAKRDPKYFINNNEVFLGGVSAKQLKIDYGLTDNDLHLYMPTSQNANNISIYYLGHFLKWHPQSAYYYAVENGGFIPSPERTPGTYSKYNSIDDKIDDYHYYTTYIKFGIGRATYDAAQEIRNGDIDRDEGVALVKKFDGEYPTRFENDIFDYLSITEKHYPKAHKMFKTKTFTHDSFMELTNKFRSPHLWYKENNQWKLRKTVYESNR